MASDDEDGFDSFAIEDAVRDLLDKRLRFVKYERQRCGQLSQDLCSAVRKITKEILEKEKTDPSDPDVFKLAIHVFLGQDTDSLVHMHARCLWAPQSDRLALVTHRTPYMYVVAIVCAVRTT